jgi:hypothetical protein
MIKEFIYTHLQVDTQTTCAGTQNETELFAIRSIEFIDGSFSRVIIGVTINTTVLVTTLEHEILQDIQNTRHLRENENT